MSGSTEKEASLKQAPLASPSPSHDSQASTADAKEQTEKVEKSVDDTQREKSADQEDDDSDSESSDDKGNEKQSTPSSSEANTESRATSTPGSGQHPTAGAWQAIWSPQYNAYYFYNTETQETTWSNPIQPGSSSGPEQAEAGPSTSSAPGYASQQAALEAAAIAQGIDPSLAYLDPTLAQSISTSGGAPSGALGPTFTARFNARTGQFTRPDGRDPTHLSEYERMKRMSEFYFDVNAWEKEVAQRNAEAEEEEAGTKKRKRPSKKDLERFKEQKRLKKIAKTAWLRT
ncbi:hypothetical protein AX16_007138 [Volvariella volvacea WC 439]|nr:hypothetical protein AX16_007138 [Volvariella volvacea WC 439]